MPSEESRTVHGYYELEFGVAITVVGVMTKGGMAT
jgi:hypothetical protein